MSRPDWRSPGAYEDVQSLDAPGFAWQFLRRNPDFIRAWRALDQATQDGTLKQADLDAFAQHWGVRFRASKPNCTCRLDAMEGAGAAQCGCFDDGPAASC